MAIADATTLPSQKRNINSIAGFGGVFRIVASVETAAQELSIPG
jgi:hypothetical protein